MFTVVAVNVSSKLNTMTLEPKKRCRKWCEKSTQLFRLFAQSTPHERLETHHRMHHRRLFALDENALNAIDLSFRPAKISNLIRVRFRLCEIFIHSLRRVSRRFKRYHSQSNDAHEWQVGAPSCQTHTHTRVLLHHNITWLSILELARSLNVSASHAVIFWPMEKVKVLFINKNPSRIKIPNPAWKAFGCKQRKTTWQ